MKFKVHEIKYEVDGVEEFLKKYGLSQCEFSKIIGIPTGQLQSIMKKETFAGINLKNKIETASRVLIGIRKPILDGIKEKVESATKPNSVEGD